MAVAVIDDGEQSEAAQPVGEHHRAGGDGANVRAQGGVDDHALPGHATAGAGLPEASMQLAFDGPRQAAGAEPRAGGGRIGCACHPCPLSLQLVDERLQAPAAGFELFALAVLVRDIRAQVRDQALALLAFVEQFAALLAQRRLGLLRLAAFRTQPLFVRRQRAQRVAEGGDRLGARFGNGPVVAALALEVRRILLVEQRLQVVAAGEPPSVAQVIRHPLRLAGAALLQPLALGGEFGEGRFALPDFLAQRTGAPGRRLDAAVGCRQFPLLGGQLLAGVVQPDVERIQLFRQFCQLAFGVL